MSWYCAVAVGHPLHGPYHDNEYGFPVTEESVFFERLCLEVFQAGLSWEIILKKRPTTFEAFDGFDVDKVAAYREPRIKKLLENPGIIRNRRKVEAIIENAKRFQALRKTDGGFKAWLDAHHPLSLDDWVKLFKKTFVFTGGEVVNEFLMSTGYMHKAHKPSCPVYKKIAKLNPPWMRKRVKQRTAQKNASK
jgi:DNA-3-methyladenine glycosylase I